MGKYNSRYPTTILRDELLKHAPSNVNNDNPSGLDTDTPKVNQCVISVETEDGDKSAHDPGKPTTQDEDEHSPFSKRRKVSQPSDDDGGNNEPSATVSDIDEGDI